MERASISARKTNAGSDGFSPFIKAYIPVPATGSRKIPFHPNVLLQMKMFHTVKIIQDGHTNARSSIT
jgi:hypothetical protein